VRTIGELMAPYRPKPLRGKISWRAAVRVIAGAASAIAFLVLVQSAAAADTLTGVPASSDTTVAAPASGVDAVAAAEPASLAVEPTVEPRVVALEPPGDPLGGGGLQPILQPVVVPLADAEQVFDPVTSTLDTVVAPRPPGAATGLPVAPRFDDPSPTRPNDDVRATVLLRPPLAQTATPGPVTGGVASSAWAQPSVDHTPRAAGVPRSGEMPGPPRQSESPVAEVATMTLRAGSTEQLPVIGALAVSVLLLAFSTAHLLAPALVALHGRPVLVPVPPG
jgi:hypothetical protein